jgi:aspartate racemase
MSTRLVGLLGGMSPATTVHYYALINKHVASVLGGNHSANLLIRSVDYADIARFTTSKNYQGMTHLLVSRAREVQLAGAKAVAICANVAHVAAEAIEREIGLQVLHIADFTGQAIQNAGLKRVGLLGTRVVMEEEFYRARLESKYGVEVFVPGERFRERADDLIFVELNKPKIEPSAIQELRDAFDGLVTDHHVEGVVLACTEFRLAFADHDSAVPTFETAELHARGIAEWTVQTGQDPS